MDTDDMTPAAHEIIANAEKVIEVLRIDIAVSCRKYAGEDDFLQATIELLDRILQNPLAYLDSWKAAGEVDLSDFEAGVKALRKQAVKVMITPLEERGKPPAS
jgi:hypothetical protein